MQGILRIYQKLAQEYLTFFPCIALIGPRQCGKTTLMKELSKGWKQFDLEQGSDFNYISEDPDLFFRLNSHQVAIDEAQLLPELFKSMRVAIDDERTVRGRFIITGSSSPDLLESISESLAGRIGIIEMSPLLLGEVTLSKNSTFPKVFKQPEKYRTIISQLETNASIDLIHKYWFYGGYPEPWVADSKRFYEVWFSQYVRTYIDRDISRLFPGLNRQRFYRFIEMLAGLSGSVINYSEVARALSVSQTTIKDYFQIAHGTFIWRQILAYDKNVKKRVVKHPKGYFRDTGILHYLMRIKDLQHLLTHPNMGFSWESLVTEEIIKVLETNGIDFNYYYYRTSSGAEVDLILEGKFGLVPIEIKYAGKIKKSAIIGIKNFMNDFNCQFGLIIYNGQKVFEYDSNMYAVPFSFCV